MRNTILIALVLSGCGSTVVTDYIHRTDHVNHRTPYVEEEFKVIVARFEARYSTQVSMAITWRKLDKLIMGECHFWDDGYRRIYIDNAKWGNLTIKGQEQLIFHELGHCQFDLDHDESKMPYKEYGNIPRSIMFPNVFGDRAYYAELKQYYYNELGSK